MGEADVWFIGRQIAFTFPALLVCFGGLVFSLFFLRKYFWPSALTIASTLIILFFSVTTPAVQAYLIHSRSNYGWTQLQYSQYLGAFELAAGLARAVAVLLLIIAVYVGRKRPVAEEVSKIGPG